MTNVKIRTLKNTLLLFISLSLLTITMFASAENAKEYSEHIVYYNAFPTDSLPVQMTKQYGLKRSKNYAMINISVMEKGAGIPTGVKSKVTGKIKNLMGQMRDLEFREIKEGQAIYYIAQVGVQRQTVVHFSIDIIPEGSSENYDIDFSEKF